MLQGDVIGIFDGSGNCVVTYNWDNAWGYNPEPEGTMAATHDTLNLPKIPGGKKLIYTQISLPLMAVDDLAEAGKFDPLFAELNSICKVHNGLWNGEAEKYLLDNAKRI